MAEEQQAASEQETFDAREKKAADKYLQVAEEVMRGTIRASINGVKQGMHVGYGNGTRYIDWLEMNGVIAPYDPAKPNSPRTVLVAPADIPAKLEELAQVRAAQVARIAAHEEQASGPAIGPSTPEAAPQAASENKQEAPAAEAAAPTAEQPTAPQADAALTEDASAPLGEAGDDRLRNLLATHLGVFLAQAAGPGQGINDPAVLAAVYDQVAPLTATVSALSGNRGLRVAVGASAIHLTGKSVRAARGKGFDQQAATAIVALALARGWTDLKLHGTKREKALLEEAVKAANEKLAAQGAAPMTINGKQADGVAQEKPAPLAPAVSEKKPGFLRKAFAAASGKLKGAALGVAVNLLARQQKKAAEKQKAEFDKTLADALRKSGVPKKDADGNVVENAVIVNGVEVTLNPPKLTRAAQLLKAAGKAVDTAKKALAQAGGELARVGAAVRGAAAQAVKAGQDAVTKAGNKIKGAAQAVAAKTVTLAGRLRSALVTAAQAAGGFAAKTARAIGESLPGAGVGPGKGAQGTAPKARQVRTATTSKVIDPEVRESLEKVLSGLSGQAPQQQAPRRAEVTHLELGRGHNGEYLGRAVIKTTGDEPAASTSSISGVQVESKEQKKARIAEQVAQARNGRPSGTGPAQDRTRRKDNIKGHNV